MINFDKLTCFFRKNTYSATISSSTELKHFKEDIEYLNYSRLRNMLLLMIPLVLFIFYVDIRFEDLWSKNSSFYLFSLDLALLLYTLIMLGIMLFDVVKTPGDIHFRHILYIRLTVIAVITWIALTSVGEFSLSNSSPTFIIGCFFISAFFMLKPRFLISCFVLSLTLPAFNLSRNGASSEEIYHFVIPSVVMLILAFLISRTVFNNQIKAFHAAYELKNNNLHLDDLVSIRTQEITEINQKLNSEIEARLKFEKQLKKEIAKAEEADHLKSAFLANMSHEIRTPLNGIVGFSDLLIRDNLSPEKRERYTTIIKNNSNQLMQLIDDIIDISMIESNQLRFNYTNIKLSPFYCRIHDFFSNTIKEQKQQLIKFESALQLNNNENDIFIDETRLQQVIYNLIGNSLKFTKEGYIKLLLRRDKSELFVMVEDSGIGIIPEKRDVIFERFRQLDSSPNRKYGGTGLGLSISKGILTHMKGKIWLDFSHTIGARFCFTIPDLPDEHAFHQHPAVNTGDNKTKLRSKEFILFTKDDTMSAYLDKYLAPAKLHTVSTYANLSEILSGKTDLVIYHQNGKEFNANHAKTLQEITRQNKIIILTDNEQLIPKIKASGYDIILQVPLNLSRLYSEL